MSRGTGLKIAAGLAIVAVLAAGGYFGFVQWAKAKVRAEVETAFSALREQGTKASFADATFDARAQAIVITGISLASADSNATLKVDRLVARGSDKPRDRRVALDALDLDGVEVTVTGEGAAGGTLTYSLPQVMIDRYSGPISLVAAGEGNGPFGAMRVWLRQLAATSAAKVTIPEVRGRVAPAAGPAMDITYKEVAAEGLNAGTIRSLLVDRITFALTPPAGAPGAAGGRVSGQVAGVVASQIDTAPLLAMTAPDGGKAGDAYARVYGKVVTGPYTLAQDGGPTLSAAALLLEHAGIRPAAFDAQHMTQLNALSLKGDNLSPDEARRLLDLSREAMNGLAFRTVAITDLRSRYQNQEGRIASLRLEGLAAGVLDALTLEGMEGRTSASAPDGAVNQGKLARFTVRQVDFNQLARFAAEGQANTPLAVLGVFKALSRVELEGLEVPHGEGPDSGPVRIGAFTMGWSGVSGALPTALDISLTDAAGPITAEDGEPFSYLLAAGIKRASVSLAFKAAFDADKGALAVGPLTAEVKDAFRLRVEGAVQDMPSAAFTDAVGFLTAWPKLSAGPWKLTLTDLGLSKLMYAQLAAEDGVSEEEYRGQVLALTEGIVGEFAAESPEAAEVGAAVVAFLRQPGTLTISATPRVRVPLSALVATDDPGALFEVFAFSASATTP